MRNGLSSRAVAGIAATTVTAAMAFAPSALAGTAGTSAWRVQQRHRLGRLQRVAHVGDAGARRAQPERAQTPSSPSPTRPLTPAQFAAQFAPVDRDRRRHPQLGGHQQPHGLLGVGQPAPGHAERLLQPALERAADRLRALPLRRQRQLLRGLQGGSPAQRICLQRDGRARSLQPREGRAARAVGPLRRGAPCRSGRLPGAGPAQLAELPGDLHPAAAERDVRRTVQSDGRRPAVGDHDRGRRQRSPRPTSPRSRRPTACPR